MFWRKKTSNEELFEYELSTRRGAFRLQSEAMGPAVAIFNDSLVEIIDISAGGISFECKGCKLNDIGTVQIELPGHIIQSINLSVEILRISEETICHTRFTEIDEATEEKIHQYILFRQIATQRRLRSIKGKEGC